MSLLAEVQMRRSRPSAMASPFGPNAKPDCRRSRAHEPSCLPPPLADGTVGGIRQVDRGMREQKAREIARSAAIAEAHEEAALAAEAARHEAREKELPYAQLEAAGQTAYDSVYRQIYQKVYDDLQKITLRLLDCYDRQPYPASVTATALAAEILDEFDPQHQFAEAIAWAARATFIKLANKILEACKPPEEPN
jgi:hypothetical protein